MALPDLITLAYAQSALAIGGLTAAQQAFLPTCITAASSAVRSWCNRLFTQQTYIEEVPVRLNGTIRLAQVPINQLYRIQANPQVALTIINGTANSAWVSIATTGDVYAGLSITGMTLNWESGGILSTQPITYTTNETISLLATAINAVGSGWQATADPVLGGWSVTEIMDGLASKGAGGDDQPSGAEFRVYGRNITNAQFFDDDGPRTGIVWVGRQSGGGVDWSWGPDAPMFASSSAVSGKVKATYNGGLGAVPDEVQLATVELVKDELYRLRLNPYLTSEKADLYSYTLDPKRIMALPREVLEGLSRYRVPNA